MFITEHPVFITGISLLSAEVRTALAEGLVQSSENNWFFKRGMYVYAWNPEIPFHMLLMPGPAVLSDTTTDL